MMTSETMEDYLKAIYEVERTEGPPVSTSAVATLLDVTPPTASSMLKKLAEQGLVDREEFAGVELTDTGEAVALEVIRHHRLLECFLAEHLDYDWADVHEEADALEHHISEEFEQRLAAVLDDPSVDPHGDPIPGPDLEPLAADETTPLSAVESGRRVVVVRVEDREPEELRYLASQGIEPGCEIEFRERTPLDTYVVAGDAGDLQLPESVADAIRVRAADGQATSTQREVSS
jgi:DtxR family Mn-dependent transcriptional regulator